MHFVGLCCTLIITYRQIVFRLDLDSFYSQVLPHTSEMPCLKIKKSSQLNSTCLFVDKLKTPTIPTPLPPKQLPYISIVYVIYNTEQSKICSFYSYFKHCPTRQTDVFQHTSHEKDKFQSHCCVTYNDILVSARNEHKPPSGTQSRREHSENMCMSCGI